MFKTQFVQMLVIAAALMPSIYTKYTRRDAKPLPTVSVLGPTASLLEPHADSTVRPPKKAEMPQAQQLHVGDGWTIQIPKRK